MSARIEHWQAVHRDKAMDRVSWFQASPEASLAAIGDALPQSPLIDVGGGASRLVDALLRRGWTDLTVLDVSDAALGLARARLGDAAAGVDWIAADVTLWTPRRRYRVWHDRAVFHFLTEAAEREAYRAALLAGTAPGALVVVATFAEDGPERCSGLAVARYDAAALAASLGPAFALERAWREPHRTPGGAVQAFQWCALRRREMA